MRWMRMKRTAVLVLASCSAASADDVTIEPNKDNTLYESVAGALSNGQGPTIFAGKTNFSNLIRRALIRFDVAGAIPAGSTITAVELSMTCSQSISGAVPVSLHRVSQDWGEGASNANIPGGGGAVAEPGDATWLHTFWSTATWTNQGGDFAAMASATTLVGDNPARYSWLSTAGMVADVQAWLDAPAGNFGWIVIGDESTTATAKRFESRESLVASDRPLLKITFTPPASTCYANCDASTTVPILNVNDFVCFLNRFGAGASYANCDGSTTTPVLNINDFVCFLNAFGAGCT
ncbi:MAG: DNRLRE domain-containing protein [Phycisphaerales bacterium]